MVISLCVPVPSRLAAVHVIPPPSPPQFVAVHPVASAAAATAAVPPLSTRRTSPLCHCRSPVHPSPIVATAAVTPTTAVHPLPQPPLLQSLFSLLVGRPLSATAAVPTRWPSPLRCYRRSTPLLSSLAVAIGTAVHSSPPPPPPLSLLTGPPLSTAGAIL